VWFVVRQAQAHPPVDPDALRRRIVLTLASVLSGALIGGGLGWGLAVGIDAEWWRDFWPGFAADYGILDVAGFRQVACIHYGGYLGAASGWVWVMWRARA
jgi:hypothetical protein